MADIIPDQEKCHYNYLGRSGLKVSNICLGAMTFGQTVSPALIVDHFVFSLLHDFLRTFQCLI